MSQWKDAMTLDVAVTDEPSDEALEVIGTGLDQFNLEAAGYADRRALAVLVTDPASGKVVGGLTGRTSLGMWFVDLFHLPAAHRGNGLGSRVLKAAEDEARRRGCRSGVLYTLSFQAPDFYVKHGWVVFGRVPCDPAGTCRVFLSKDLSVG
ncbi:GNAT family N-acetyltransferase [Stenotrophomonas maltophilia]|uniref:GNAT family N-acetyltransferase n=2 Tax=Stenotrophomonas TaxID=40323 RepID=UPI0021CA4A50|nr:MULTISPECIES: GNAT family N-acetyltransferase [Stenotrophomonas]